MSTKDQPEERDPDTIYATGIVSARTGGPFLQLDWGDKRAQMDPHEAANHVQLLMREAWWAEADAALQEFLMLNMNLDRNAAGVFLADYRRHRYSRLDQAAFEAARKHRAFYEAEIRREIAEGKHRDQLGGGGQHGQ